MDPLSITTGIVTLLAACSTISRTFDKIRRIRHVPDILYSLNNEISDLRLILLDMHDRREEFLRKDSAQLTDQDRRLLELLHTVLERALSRVHESEILIATKLLKGTQKSKFKLDLMRLSQERDRLARLQVNIRDTKQTIYGLWGQLGLRKASEIEVQLGDVLVISTGIQEQLRQDTPLLLESSNRIEGKLDRLMRMQLGRATSGSSPEPRSPSVRSSEQANLQRVDIPIVRLSYPVNPEEGLYGCPHRRSIQASLRTIIGNMFFGYAATPIFNCNEQRCRCKPHASVIMVFSFPQWFPSYVLSLSACYTALQGLQCFISVQPILSAHHEVWSLLEHGRLERIKGLIESRQLSPNARGSFGEDLLMVIRSY